MFPRTQEASDLLSEIIKHGAVEGNLGKHYLAVNNQDEHFLQLRNLGFIKYLEDTGDSIVATKKALHAVQPTLVYFSPAHTHEYMSDTVPAEPNMTVIDLLLALLVAGWSEKGFPPKKSVEPYRIGAEKHVFYHTGSALCKFYLRALLNSETIFAKGIVAIYYWQSEAYYRTLLECDAAHVHLVRPSLTLKEYKGIRQGNMQTSLPQPHAAVSDDEAVMDTDLRNI